MHTLDSLYTENPPRPTASDEVLHLLSKAFPFSLWSITEIHAT